MPGYILHLTEAKLIAEELKKQGRYPGDAWYNLFALGNLLPDTKRKTEKVTSHFWNPDTMINLAIAPDMERFEQKYGSRVTGPLMLGYWTHLQLDYLYVKSFWDRVMEFRNDAGGQAVKKADITQVYLKNNHTLVPEEQFFTREYYYGDYNRMNAPLLMKYHLEIPVYRENIYCPVTEVEPADLQEVLDDLNRILLRQHEAEKEPLRVFDMAQLEDFIAEAAEEALPRILDDLDQSRLLAFDLDGTLLKDDKSLSETAEREINRLIDAGHEIIVASGRPIDALPENVMSICGIRYALTSNGAAIYDLQKKERICHKPMTPESARQVLNLLRENQVTGGRTEKDSVENTISENTVSKNTVSKNTGSKTACIDTGAGHAPVPEAAFEVLISGTPYTSFAFHDDPSRYGVRGTGIYYIQTSRLPVDDLYQFAENHINELDAIDIVTPCPAVKESFMKRLEGMDGLYLTHSVAHLIEISNEAAGKGPGLRWLAEHIGIPQERVYAFGNEANDMDMIEYAGCGVAVSNSPDCVKEIADFTTLSNEEDGVADFLMQF